MIDKDIKKMFLKKNREIIKNKLVLDLNNNIDSLLATILNITYLEFAIYKEKIIMIDKDNIDVENISLLIEGFEKFINNVISEFIGNKKEKCSEFIEKSNIDEGMDLYNNILNQTTDDLEEKLLREVTNYIDDYIVSFLITNNWYLHNDKKINFLLNEKLGKDLCDKIILQLKDRDIIVYNNAVESYEKYLTLNENIK